MPAGDFKEFFDVSNIDDRKLGEIEFVLTSPAYQHTFRPYIEGVVAQLNHLWKDRSQARKDQYPDDFLGGGVVAFDGLLEFFDRIIAESRMERIHASMENMTSEMLYERARQMGRLRPVVGIDQPALPDRPPSPEEDF